jgi:UDP-N-acetylglucosamine 2-epimerase (non-hydrolysing)
MMDQALYLFDIKSDYDLNIMIDNQTPTQVASAILSRLEPILKYEQPDWVLVQGDTTTTLAASLAAFYAKVSVGHVEAGLRTYDKWQPFPEEVNRNITTIVADKHFAPTEIARQNLLKEHVKPETIWVTGNSVIDALQWIARLPLEDELLDKVLPTNPDIRVVLLTVHRRENFGQGLEAICQAVRQICLRYGDAIQIIYPLHPNPNVQKPVKQLLGSLSQVKLTPPLTYRSLIQVMSRSYLVLTDSGGIQEEAPGLGKPVLVLREVTERPEAVMAGTAYLVGTDASKILDTFIHLWENTLAYQHMAQAINPYGDGRAAERIVKILLNEPVEEFSGLPKSLMSMSIPLNES